MGFANTQMIGQTSTGCLAALLLAAVSIAGCTPPVPPADVRRVPLPVHIVYPVRAERLRTTEVCFGKLMARQSVPLSFSRRGIVKSILPEPMGRVTRGQRIAQLDTPQLDQQRQTLEAALKDAQERVRASGASGQSAEATAARRRVQQLQEQLAQLGAQSASYAIMAPFDGVVVRRRLQVGDVAVPGRTALQLAADGRLVVVGSLPAAVATRVQPGQSVWVQLADETIVCVVESIGSEAGDFGASVRELVVAFTDDTDRLQQIGTVAEMRFFTEQDRAGSWVPLGALRQPGSQWIVSVVDDGRVQPLEVDVLLHMEEFVFVATDLSQMSVIVDGGHRVAIGQPVTAVDVSADYRVPFAAGGAE